MGGRKMAILRVFDSGDVGTWVEVESKPSPFERRKGWGNPGSESQSSNVSKAKGCAARESDAGIGRRPSAYIDVTL